MGKIILNGITYGGGGSGGVIYLPTIYSEEERQVGVWTDGKPLYQKTKIVPFSNFNVYQNLYYTQIVDDNTQIIRDVEAMVYSSVMVGCPIGCKTFPDSNAQRYAEVDTYYMNLCVKFVGTNNTEVQFTTAEITYKYTKTTDVAGSGNWNTDGVPTHHYSTNEQVGGTWIDGSTFYIKTVPTNDPVPTGATLIKREVLVGYDEISYIK